MYAIYNETLHDKTGSFCYASVESITELSEWHKKIIRLAFNNNAHEFYDYCIKELVDITGYEAGILMDKIFPDHDNETTTTPNS